MLWSHASHVLALAALLVLVATPVRADGAMMLGDRVLLREGPQDRGYCDDAGSGSRDECERVKTKVLSGFSYARGHAVFGLTRDPSTERAPHGLAELELHAASAALPGGAIELGSVTAVVGGADVSRVRITLADGEGLFFCRDAQNGELGLPVVAMLSRACEPGTVLALDLGVMAMQWDLARPRFWGEWLRLGPAFELLGNGHGYGHLSRSIQIGLPLDVRSAYDGTSDTSQTSVGAGVRVSALLRSRAWEARSSARYRADLLERGGLSGHAIEGELLGLHNFFLSDSIVMQAGLSLRASFSVQPEYAFSAWSSAERQSNVFAGLHLGWSHEPPDI